MSESADQALIALRRERIDSGQQPAAPSLPVDGLQPLSELAVEQSMLGRLLARLTGFDPQAQPRLQLSFTDGAQQREGGVGAPAEAGLPGTPEAGPATPLVAAGAEAQPPELGGEPSAEGRAAAEAERHRLQTSVVDIRALAASLEKTLPFVLLLLLLFILRHLVGLAAFSWLTYLLYRLNKVVRSQVALKAQRQPRPLLTAAGLVTLQVPLVLALTWRQRLWRNLFLAPAADPPATDFWDVLFAIVVVDSCARYLAVLAKVAVLLAAPADTSQRCRRRAHALTAAEYCFSLWRGLLPMPLWYTYFKAAAAGPFLSTVFPAVYVLLKCSNVYERLVAAAAACRQAVQHSAYGSAPTQEELAEAGSTCPICQDNLRQPVRLGCGHIFCEDCVGEWFERERTCPMCRAVAGSTNLRSHGDGYTTLVPVIF